MTASAEVSSRAWFRPPRRFSVPAVHRLLTIASVAAITIGTQASGAAESEAPSMYGFTPAGAVAQAALERRFDGQLNAAEIGTWLKHLSAEPNHVGAPHDKANAEFVRNLFKSWGWQADIETFYVLYPTPKRVALELIAPKTFTANLHEPPIAGDATSTRTDGLPPYNAYGADGDVTGDLVYVNYGMDDDYKELARRGVDVKGKIAIVALRRRMARPQAEARLRARRDRLPDLFGSEGRWLRDGRHVSQGRLATRRRRAARLGRRHAASMRAIRSRRVSARPRRPSACRWPMRRRFSRSRCCRSRTPMRGQLLESMTGPVAPETWRGALPITYHIGPGPARVHLSIASDWGLKPVYDVIARIPGSEHPDEWVIRGNHRDGWVAGAWDPLSGHVAMMAEAKAIGALLKSGWKPKRTIDLRELGRRRARLARFDRMGRDPRGGAAAQGRPLPELRYQHAWVLCTLKAAIRCSAS